RPGVRWLRVDLTGNLGAALLGGDSEEVEVEGFADACTTLAGGDRDAVDVEEVGATLHEPAVVFALIVDAGGHDDEKTEHPRIVGVVNGNDGVFGEGDEPSDLGLIGGGHSGHCRIVDDCHLGEVGVGGGADSHPFLLGFGLPSCTGGAQEATDRLQGLWAISTGPACGLVFWTSLRRGRFRRPSSPSSSVPSSFAGSCSFSCDASCTASSLASRSRKASSSRKSSLHHRCMRFASCSAPAPSATCSAAS